MIDEVGGLAVRALVGARQIRNDSQWGLAWGKWGVPNEKMWNRIAAVHVGEQQYKKR